MENKQVIDESIPRVGSIVRLLSGGQLMTVIAVDEEKVTCAFFGATEGGMFSGGMGRETFQTYRLPRECVRVQ